MPIITCVVHDRTGTKFVSIFDLCKILKDERDSANEESTKVYIQGLIDRLMCL